MRYILKFLRIILFFLFGIFSALALGYLFMVYFVNSSSVIKMPYLIGESKEIAVSSLKELNLIPVIEGSGDTVLYTDPVSGIAIKEGHHVLLQLRTIDQRKVPDLTDIPLESAEQFLKEYDISYTIQQLKTYDKSKDGLVIDISPKPNTQMLDNINLKIYVGVYEEVKN
ncbi:MAG TPA: PASTA domain-containing protein [Tepiditoga sp.]|nr:PASTA domain-containing protein [Thermotogota bacterium]HOO76148.1 PASTA domain-containing protein [Tepiditoga sp.]